MLAFDELDASTLLLNGHPSASGGPLVLHAGVSASALLPGGDEPFSLGSADLTATWQDVNDPLNVNVQLTGGLTDFLSVRVQELLDVLQKLRDLTTQLDGSIPPDLQKGLDQVISVVKAFNDNVVAALTNPNGGGTVAVSLQDVIERVTMRLNAELSQFGIHFDLATRKLTWDFDLGGLGLAGLGLGTDDVHATINSLHLLVGIDFSRLVDVLHDGSLYSIRNALSIKVSGEISDIDVFDVFTGGFTFDFAEQTVDVSLDGGSTAAIHDALLVTFGLGLDEAAPADPETRFLRVGVGDDYSLTIQDGSLAVAVLSAPTPTTAGASDDRRWVAVEVHGLSGSLHLGDFVNADASGIDVLVNAASGAFDPDGTGTSVTQATALNWRTSVDLQAGADTFGADPVTVRSQTIDLTTGGFTIAGELTNSKLSMGRSPALPLRASTMPNVFLPGAP